MPTYTDSVAVLAQLPASPPSTVTDHMTTDIADASGEVEALVGSNFALSYESNTQKFPNIDSDPATPSIIKLATTYLAASKQYLRLEKNFGSDGPTRTEILYERGEALLMKIANGEISISLSDGTALSVSALKGIMDTYYTDTENNDPVFTKEELDSYD